MLAYIYSLRSNLDEQKRNVEVYNAELVTAEKLIDEINAAQSEVNLYVATKDTLHHRLFKKKLALIQLTIDKLMQVSSTHSTPDETLEKIDSLLIEKGLIVTELNGVLVQKDLLENVNEFLRKYKNGQLETLFVKKQTEVKDSIVTKSPPKKGFWRKVGTLFSSKAEQDTTKISSQKSEESRSHKKEKKNDDLSKVKRFVQQASSDYIMQLVEIEDRVSDLVAADQEISFKISTLLINYYSQIIHNRFDEIHASDTLIRKNNNYTIAGGIVALIQIIISLITILRNVNKGKQARIDLENANKRIRQVMESRHQLLLSISHDIKTPLNSIMGNLDMQKEQGTVGAPYVNSMINSGKHILALLDNLLGFSSIEQGKLAVQFSPFHLFALGVEIRDMFVPLCEKKNLVFDCKFQFDRNLVLNSDSLKLKQIMINILSNAVKYTVKGRVSLSINFENDMLSLKIEDTGVGIPKDQLDKIFEPFVRIRDNSVLAEGMGFGMYVVKGLLAMFGGTIEVDSQQGVGSKFLLSIPAQKIAEPDSSGDSRKILIIDDDPALLLTLQAMVGQLKHEARICVNMDELERLLPDIAQYDLVITDMEMGAFSGLDSLEKIRRFSATIPVVLMSARSELQEEQVGRMGFSACLPKPISIDVLSVLIGRVPQAKIQTVPGQDVLCRSSQFDTLSEMFGTDKKTIAEILTAFALSSRKDVLDLLELVKKDDFEAAQQKCHKMLSMFMQVDPHNQIIPILKKMDSSRGHNGIYPDWKNAIREVIQATNLLIDKMENYLK
jgi:signal transduction histidine kinase/DNA-binding NarL/FixJ family response regulator